MAFKITTTGTLNPVIFNDLGGRSFAHPTVNFEMETEFDPVEISESADIQAAIDAGHITVEDQNGTPITETGGAITSAHDHDTFTDVLNGFAPLSGTPSGKFLKDDGTWDGITSAPVDSVFSRTGAVVAETGDYDANFIDFTPAILANWAGSADPGQTDDALDQLSSRINALEGDTHLAEVQATESVLGIAELATQAEVNSATDDLRIITPLKLGKGQANGVASLDGSGLVPAAQLPSYVEDVEEYANLAAFPGTGETGKIYVAIDTGKIYRWTGSIYVEISVDVGAPVTSVFSRTGVVVAQSGDYDANKVDFTPATLADWASSADPGQADDALDQLASRLNSVESFDYSDISGNDAATDVTGAELESLSDGSDAGALHLHDLRYFTETEFGATTTPSGASLVGYDNTASGMTADDMQAAIDELKDDKAYIGVSQELWLQSSLLNTPARIVRLYGKSADGFAPTNNIKLERLSVQFYSEHAVQSSFRVRVFRYDANATLDREILSISGSSIAVGYHSFDDVTPDLTYNTVDVGAGDTIWIEVDDGSGGTASRIREVTISTRYTVVEA